MNIFLVVFSTLLVVGYAYLGSQLILPLAWGLIWTLLAWLLLLVPFGMIAWLPLVYWRQDDPEISRGDDQKVNASFYSMGLLSFLLFFCILRDCIFLGARIWGFFSGFFGSAGFLGGAAGALAGWAGGGSRVPLAFQDYRGSLGILVLALTFLAVGTRFARGNPGVTEVEVPIANLPEALQGLRIVQVSDLHIGSTIQRPFVEGVVKTVNSLEADIIALTGDIVDGTVKQLSFHAEPLKDLRAKLGRFYVTGNHEYYWEADAWIKQFRELGMTPLLNSHQVVERAGARVIVAGVLDLWAERQGAGAGASDPKAALEGAPSDASVRLLLAHQPKTALAAASLGYDLQLSGHTHGGQFVPWTLAVSLFQPFVRGLYRVGSMWVYVNRGTGYWGPPVRLGAASEITLIRLVNRVQEG